MDMGELPLQGVMPHLLRVFTAHSFQAGGSIPFGKGKSTP